MIADITGVASIYYDIKDARTDYNDKNYGLVAWDVFKAVGTGVFLGTVGEEATLTVKGSQFIWNLGTTYMDYKLGK